eukprot:9156735-Pyramimonas_sp.AAC.1
MSKRYTFPSLPAAICTMQTLPLRLRSTPSMSIDTALSLDSAAHASLHASSVSTTAAAAANELASSPPAASGLEHVHSSWAAHAGVVHPYTNPLQQVQLRACAYQVSFLICCDEQKRRG